MLRFAIKLGLAAAMAFTLVGCDQPQRSSTAASEAGPSAKASSLSSQEVLERFLDASLNQRAEEAYAYVSTPDKAVRDLDAYVAKNRPDAQNPFSSMVKSSIAYDVIEVAEAENKAVAQVDITLPDFSVLLQEFFRIALTGAADEKGKEALQAEIAKKYEAQGMPTMTKRESFDLVREAEGWKVFLDWAGEEAEQARHARVAELEGRARDLRRADKPKEAHAAYAEILALDAEHAVAQKATRELEEKIAQAKARQAYIPMIEIYDLKSRYYESRLDGRVPGVEFKLKNNGDRELNRVEVTVYFKDASGAVIVEESYLPVFVSEYSFRDDNKPLKPGYIWQIEKGRFYVAKSVPSEWKEGAMTAEVTKIEFAD
jgi:hypothetical protein